MALRKKPRVNFFIPLISPSAYRFMQNSLACNDRTEDCFQTIFTNG
jgi:hypothetical protein